MNELGESAHLKSVILLGSELSDRSDVKSLVMAFIAENRLEQLHVARWIDDLGLVGERPQLIDVVLRPSRVYHDALGASAAPAVETRE